MGGPLIGAGYAQQGSLVCARRLFTYVPEIEEWPVYYIISVGSGGSCCWCCPCVVPPLLFFVVCFCPRALPSSALGFFAGGLRPYGPETIARYRGIFQGWGGGGSKPPLWAADSQQATVFVWSRVKQMLGRCGVIVRSAHLSPTAHTFACTGGTPNPVRGMPLCLFGFECRGQQTCFCITATL